MLYAMKQSDVYIGKGKLNGKGVYASRVFKKGEVVKWYNLTPLTQLEFDKLPQDEKKFVHSFSGKMYLFPEPSRYTNHSATPNVSPDYSRMCDVALRDIQKDEMITVNATKEVQYELETFIQHYENTQQVSNFVWLKGGYRNAIVSYMLKNKMQKKITLKRIDGNWRVLKEVAMK